MTMRSLDPSDWARVSLVETPFSHAEHATIAEVFSQYDLTPRQERAIWKAVIARWRATSGRFYAYMTAHNVAAGATYKPS